MKTPLETIESYGAPTHSFIRAIQYMNDNIYLSKDEYEKGIAEIVGATVTPTYSNEKEARLYFLYSIQETIRAYNEEAGGIPDMAVVWDSAIARAKEFIEENPWSIKEYETEEEIVVDGVVVSKPRNKKGAKKEQSEALYNEMNDGQNTRADIIAAFMDELEMSKAGATTYFHNLKKQFGFNGPKAERPKKQVKEPTTTVERKPLREKGPSKGSIALEIYKKMKDADKSEIINEIIAQTGTSKAGANTYFCAARKKAENNE